MANKTPRTISIDCDVERATQYFLLGNKGKNGQGAKNFSEAVEQGLRLLFNRRGTSVAKLNKAAAAAN